MKNSELKNRDIFNVSFADYEFITIQKNAEMGKSLNYRQVRFLRFLFYYLCNFSKKKKGKSKTGKHTLLLPYQATSIKIIPIT